MAGAVSPGTLMGMPEEGFSIGQWRDDDFVIVSLRLFNSFETYFLMPTSKVHPL
jgi:hypothetical protein